jgi:hypothetical protein
MELPAQREGIASGSLTPLEALPDLPRGQGPLVLHFATQKRSRAATQLAFDTDTDSDADVEVATTPTKRSPPKRKINRSPTRSPKKAKYAESTTSGGGAASAAVSHASEEDDDSDSSQLDSPLLAPPLSLETFLNNQNPGLGTRAAPFLKGFGITAQAQFSRFRNIDWWLEFWETRLAGKGLSEIDE